MPELIVAIWVYFGACGFSAEDVDEKLGTSGAVTKPAPNIKGYWVKKEAIIGIVDWRRQRGIECTSIYAMGAGKPVHVIGTTEKILEKLRE